MIEARGLTRRYGDFAAVRDVSFSVADGEILGILGPNGAGKTTTIRMITGFLPPTAGGVWINGKSLREDPLAARRQLGYLPESVALYPEMRLEEYLAYRARLAGLGRGEAKGAIDRAVDSCLLGEKRRQVIGQLSKGYRQRVALAAAILHGPQVLVLDEPTVGLDPKQIIAIRELIRDLGRERTLLLSTHILPEVEQLCQRVLIIDRGRLVAEGTPEELRAQSASATEVRIAFEGEVPDAGDALGAVDGVDAVLPGDGHLRLRCASGADPRAEIFRLAVERGWVLVELSQRRASLEDVFVRLTRGQGTTQDPDGAAAELDNSHGTPGDEGSEALGPNDTGPGPEDPVDRSGGAAEER
ncbi:MAG: ATP-binding cassette domain-containing protein [Acidobacteriota bacterium]